MSQWYIRIRSNLNAGCVVDNINSPGMEKENCHPCINRIGEAFRKSHSSSPPFTLCSLAIFDCHELPNIDWTFACKHFERIFVLMKNWTIRLPKNIRACKVEAKLFGQKKHQVNCNKSSIDLQVCSALLWIVLEFERRTLSPQDYLNEKEMLILEWNRRSTQ